MNWFRFGNPELLLFFLFGFPPIILLLLYGMRQKRKAMLLFQSNVDILHFRRHKLQAILLILCFLFLVLAVANPQWGAKPESVAERLDVMFALDISTSMLAKDGNGAHRLARAKDVMLSLLDRLEGDRIGLLYFAEASVVVCPLTRDVNTLKEFLAAMTPETLAHRGTRIGNAIEVATSRLNSYQNKLTTTDITSNGQKVLILFTDGENHDENAIQSAQTATEEGVYIYCIGVGNTDKSVPIPLILEQSVFKRDVRGQLVLTMLNEEGLLNIAKAGNGNYYHVDEGTGQLLDDLSRLERQKYRVSSDGKYQERFQLFIAFALILLVGELLIQLRMKQNE